jgi:Tfp pilus assembly protein PilX
MSGRYARYSDDDEYDYEPPSRGMSGAAKGVLAFLFVCVLVGIAVLIWYFGFRESDEDKKKRLEAEKKAADAKLKTCETTLQSQITKAESDKKIAEEKARLAVTQSDPYCNFQQTKTHGSVICPVGYDTKYNYGVNVAANCTTESAPCNRCIGKAYPQAWLDADPTLKWETLPATITNPMSTGNRVMSYSGTYVADPKPFPKAAGEKCFYSVPTVDSPDTTQCNSIKEDIMELEKELKGLTK